MNRSKRVREVEFVLPAWANELEECGFMVIPGVVSPEKCDQVRDGLFQWFESVADSDGKSLGFDRNHPKSFFEAKMPSSFRGIYQQYGLGQSHAAWSIRQDANVHEKFSKLYGTDDLVTSIDAVCVMPPPEVKGRGFDDGKRWYHFDQRATGLHCIQGFVAVTESDEDDGTLVVLERSHKYHSLFMETFGSNYPKADDWIKFNPYELNWLQSQPGVREVRVKAPKGSLVLWDSRAAHCNCYPQKGRAHPDRWRMVVYVCQQPLPEDPRERAKIIQKKQNVMRKGRTTSHWPLKNKMFPERTRFGIPPALFQLPHDTPYLTPLGLRLAGFRDDEDVSLPPAKPKRQKQSLLHLVKPMEL